MGERAEAVRYLEFNSVSMPIGASVLTLACGYNATCAVKCLQEAIKISLLVCARTVVPQGGGPRITSANGRGCRVLRLVLSPDTAPVAQEPIYSTTGHQGRALPYFVDRHQQVGLLKRPPANQNLRVSAASIRRRSKFAERPRTFDVA